jgi:hypothetical protein
LPWLVPRKDEGPHLGAVRPANRERGDGVRSATHALGSAVRCIYTYQNFDASMEGMEPCPTRRLASGAHVAWWLAR